MSYHFSETVGTGFDEAIARATKALTKEGFGVLSDIDVQAAMKKRLGADFGRYRILGACHPQSAYRALQMEDKIGTMLPCYVIIQERETGVVEVSAVDPVASMRAIENPELSSIAQEVRAKLKALIVALQTVGPVGG